jgi:ribosomal protein L7/L12
MVHMEIFVTAVLILLLVGLIMLGLASSANARREQLRAAGRLAAIERKLDAVVAHLGIAVPEREMPEVLRLIRDGSRIEAIRAYRNETGASLLDAKNAVDAMAARLGR